MESPITLFICFAVFCLVALLFIAGLFSAMLAVSIYRAGREDERKLWEAREKTEDGLDYGGPNLWVAQYKAPESGLFTNN